MKQLHHAPLCFSLAALLACGGTVSRNAGDDARAGSSSGGSSSGSSGSSSGTGARAGAPGVGGGVGTAGSLALVGGPNCVTVDCEPAACGPDEAPVLKTGACCEICEPRAGGCEDVKCQPVEGCRAGYELAQPPGACCAGCVPIPGQVGCNLLPCPSTSCPPGYTTGDKLGGCCDECVPDPLYCGENDDCVMAEKPSACCGCPEAITWRQYEAEPCWSEVGAPRSIPQSCYPEATCQAPCAPCETLGAAVTCAANRCEARHLGLK
jgi:hypothetical protein